MKKILLSVAGYDPSGGAGVLLDLKVFRELGFEGTGVLTALTAQNTESVKKVLPLPPGFIQEQYEALVEDVSISGIKIGMVGSGKIAKTIGMILAKNKKIPRVVDPIFKSSSGAWLLERKAIPSYMREIRGKASVITPNLDEAALITGRKVKNLEEMRDTAKKIYGFTHVPCLIKGGHLEKEAINLLYDGNNVFLFGNKKIKKNVHGTGCFFSSSLLCYLARGKSLAQACELATHLTYKAIKSAVRISPGRYTISFPLD